MLQAMGSQRVRQDLVTEQQQQFIQSTNFWLYLARTMDPLVFHEKFGYFYMRHTGSGKWACPGPPKFEVSAKELVWLKCSIVKTVLKLSVEK